MGALSHIRVLDLTRVLAGPWTTQILGDLGAEVIKVERPGEGDEIRRFGPPFLTRKDGSQGDATYFFATNRNKKSLAIDIAKPEGAALVKRLARRSHVLVENFKTGDLARYGLNYEALAADNPGLIYCSVTGFGHSGPYRNRPGYDYLIQAMGGLMSVTGHPDGTPGGEPMKVGIAVSDLATGFYSTIAILAALVHQGRTGEGQSIDMALFDCQAAALANQATAFLCGGVVPERLGNAHPSVVPYSVFAASDGFLILAIANDGQFRRFCGVAGTDWPQDTRFATNAARVVHRAEMIEALKPVMASRSMSQWISQLEAVSVPCGPINRVDQVFSDPQAVARGLTVSMSHPDADSLTLGASPLRLSKTPPEYRHAPPLLGQHTEEVLSGMLNLGEGEIAALRDAGVI